MKRITLFLFVFLLSWQINAQCDPGFSTVNLTTSGGSYPTEKWVNITTEANGGGTVVWSQGNGTYGNGAGLVNVNICLAPGQYYINCYDKYADGWDGTKYSVVSYGTVLANNGDVSPDNPADGDSSSAWETPELEIESSEMFTVTAPPSCLPPTGLTSDTYTSNSASISWSAAVPAPSQGYEYYYSKVNVAPTSPTENNGTVAAGVLTANLAGLDGNTQYFFWVRSLCDGADMSPWTSSANFTTLCGVYTPSPTFSNNFSTFPGACWTRSNAGTKLTGPTGTGNGGWGSKTYLNTGSNTGASFNLYGNSTIDSHWLISPSINLTSTGYRLKYNVGLTDYGLTTAGTMGSDVVEVLISEDAGVTWEVLKTYDAANSPIASGMLEMVNLSSYSGEVKIAFLVTDNLDLTSVQDSDFFIDEFIIEEVPTCEPVAAITISSVTDSGATVTWTAPSTAPSSGYEFYYSLSNVTPATAGTAESATTTALSGLTAESTYFVWVRSICAVGNESSWVGPVSFFTGHCVPSSSANGTYINSFSTTGGMTNISNLTSGYTTGGYQNNFATGTVTSYTEGTVSFSSVLVGGSAGTAIWIDWNKDFIFDDATEKVFTTISYGYDQTGNIMVPAGTPVGDYRMRVRVDYNDSTPDACASTSTRTEAEDYKFAVVLQPTDDVDFANIQAFVVNSEAVSTMQDCQSVDVYAQAWQEGSTDSPGQAPGLLAWIGYSTENTDPATWPESAFTAASYNTDSGSNDEFKVSYSDLPAGTYYFASRFQLNFGPYRYGADGNFWNGTTVMNKVFTIATPAIVVTASQTALCSGESTTLSVTSDNANYSYVWDNSLGNGESFEVSPVSGATYTVVATDSVTGCSVTGAVSVIVYTLPPAVDLNLDSATICDGETVELIATGGTLAGTVVSGTGALTTLGSTTSSTLGPNPLQNYYGGVKQQWLYTASELANLGFSEGTEIAAIKINLATANELYALEDLIIKMKLSETTSYATESAWETGMETVKTAASHMPTVGLNSFALDQSFVWDGTSSLVIEMSYSNENGGDSGTKNTAKYTATSFPSTLFYRDDSKTATEIETYIDAASSRLSFRTDVSFDYTTPTTLEWTPAEGLYTDQAATVAYVAGASVTTVYAKPTGNMTYEVVSSTASCSSPATSVAITVNAIVTPDFAPIATICAGDDAPVLELTSPNGVQGTWNPATVDNTTTGEYVFTPNAGQCALTQTLTVTVNEAPMLVITNPAAVCASGTVDITSDDITAGSSTDLVLSYWADPAGTVTFPAPDAITSSGTFFVKAENANGCSVIMPVTVEVKDAVNAPTTTTPVQDFTDGDDLSTFDVTGENLTWYDAETAGNVLASTTVITTGTVYYVSQTIDGCESADRLMITAGEDLKASGFDSVSFKYYPNPVSDVLTITYSNAIESVEIFNVLGQRVYQKAHNSQEVKVDMSSLADGNYIVNVLTNGLVKNIKVIKK